MKKLLCILMLLALAAALCACGSPAASETTAANEVPAAVDVDLTQISSTVAYSELYNMLAAPDNYLGKTVRLTGTFAALQDESNGEMYYACLLDDSTACCSQALEFVWEGDHSYPQDYPELGATVTVEGVFETYLYGDYACPHLVDAKLQWNDTAI